MSFTSFPRAQPFGLARSENWTYSKVLTGYVLMAIQLSGFSLPQRKHLQQ